jgi:hypothetical protein
MKFLENILQNNLKILCNIDTKIVIVTPNVKRVKIAKDKSFGCWRFLKNIV